MIEREAFNPHDFLICILNVSLYTGSDPYYKVMMSRRLDHCLDIIEFVSMRFEWIFFTRLSIVIVFKFIWPIFVGRLVSYIKKKSFQERFECYIVTYADSHLHTCTYICRIIHSDTTIKTHAGINDAWRKTQEDFFTIISTSLSLLQGFERVVQGLHVRGCWRANINFIFWPHCYDRDVVSFLFSWCWGPLHRGFPRTPSVGCGFPYHIWSLAVWNSTGNCFSTRTQLS